MKSLRLALLGFCLALPGCISTGTSSAAPTTSSLSPANQSAVQSLGYTYDGFLTAQAAWLAYLDGNPSPSVVVAVRPVYEAAKAAVKSYSDAVLAGVASGTQPATLTNALAAFQAALAQYSISKG